LEGAFNTGDIVTAIAGQKTGVRKSAVNQANSQDNPQGNPQG
jgi:hypothetical protein